jgi:hypothetical protein
MINEEFSEEIISKFAQSYLTLENRQASFFIADNKLNINTLKEGLNENLDSVETYFCFSDPSEFDYPGWMLRNFLFLLLKKCDSLKGKEIKVLSLRRDQSRSFKLSRVYFVEMPLEFNADKSTIKWTGWERNIQGKLQPKGRLN